LAPLAAGCEDLAAILSGILAIPAGPARDAARERNAATIRDLLARQRELLAVLDADPAP
jgi:hypothetical protein